MLCNNIHYKL